MVRGDPWTPDCIELLRVGAAAKLSASQIARTLPAHFSRNAVIGKMGRLGIKAGRQPGRIGGSAEQVATKKRPVVAALRQGLPAPVTSPVCPPVTPEPPRVAAAPAPAARSADAKAGRPTIFDLRSGMCRFPLFEGTEPNEQRFYCGLPTAEIDGSWCEHCAKVVCAPTNKFTRTA